VPPAEQLYAENLGLKAKVSSLEEELAMARWQVEMLKRKVFGGGQGESLDKAQLSLGLPILERPAMERPIEKVSYERSKPGKREDVAERFEKLPVKETIVIDPEEVKAAPHLYECIGEERTFEVDVVEPKLVKREIVRRKYRHKVERTRAPVLAPAPKRIVPGGYASAGLISWVLLSKYVDHLPLYRLEKQTQRWGARISRQTMSDMVEHGAQWLGAIHRLMHEGLLKKTYLQVDETPVRCQDPDTPGKTVEGWLWALSDPDGDVVFDWRLSRRHAEAKTLVKGFQGRLQSDGYEAYASLCEERPELVHLGCWAHARRKFAEALQTAPEHAAYMLRLIGHLYSLERGWADLDVGTRKWRRERDATVVLSFIKRVAVFMRERHLPRSPMGLATGYLLRQWEKLVRHVEHGDTRLDTNLMENAIRPTAIGKKNWLFIGHPDAGQRSAIIYSVVVSCQRHGIEPMTYLRDVLTRLPQMTNQHDIEALTPGRWKQTQALQTHS
jgi:transposase